MMRQFLLCETHIMTARPALILCGFPPPTKIGGYKRARGRKQRSLGSLRTPTFERRCPTRGPNIIVIFVIGGKLGSDFYPENFW